MTHDDEQPEEVAAAEVEVSESSSDEDAAAAGEAVVADDTVAAETKSEAETKSQAEIETEAAPAPAPASTPPVSARRPMWQRVAQLVLPPVLAAGAMGMHWWINVPDKILESPHDQGVKKDKKKEKKKREPRERRARKNAREEIRSSEELDAEWERLHTTPFDEEPTLTSWARRHQIVINRIVVEARRQAFEGAPDVPNVVLASTTCRTIRCRFVLRSPSAEELERMGSALERLQISDEPAWRSFELETLPSEDSEPAPAVPLHRVQVTVAFRTDDNDTSALEVLPVTAGNDDTPGDADAPDEVDEPDDADEP